MGDKTNNIKLNGFGGTVIRRAGPAFVEALDAPESPLYAIHLAGSHYEMGRQYGLMLGDMTLKTYEMMIQMLVKSGMPEIFAGAVGQRAWSYYSQYTPAKYLRELEGIADGAAESGVALNLGMLEALAAVPEFTSYCRLEEMLGSLADEPEPDIKPVWDGKERGPEPIHCSAFMAWGSRCEQGRLFGCRNLDWEKDIGMAAHKSVTVFHPVDDNGEPENASAIFGYIGMLGAMAGMNARGIALSEIGAFNIRETFQGRPWHYAFREVLDEARDMDGAKKIFLRGNFLQGYCFVAGWGAPHAFGTGTFAPAGVSVEVDAENTEILKDDDPKEREALCVDTDGNPILFDGEPLKYGLPLKDATFRADTAFAASVRSGQCTDKGPARPGQSGNAREGRTWRELYQPISRAIQSLTEGLPFEDAPDRWSAYASPGPAHPMTRDEALGICIAAGDNKDNVMSVFYDASQLKAAVAFETGTGDTWTPAAKSGYIELNFNGVF